MIYPLRVDLPDKPWSLAAAGPAGPIYVTCLEPVSSRLPLLAVDPSGAIAWKRDLQRAPDTRPLPIRVGDDGTIWSAIPGTAGPALDATGPDGAGLGMIDLICAGDESLGAFVLLPDGFILAWTTGPPYRGARLERLSRDGKTAWSTAIPAEPLSFSGLVHADASTGWQARQQDPAVPEVVQLDPSEPLLVSGDRILACYRDMRSGLGVGYFLAAADGRITGSTQQGPLARRAIAGPGQFLVGYQGYGEASTLHYDKAGTQLTRWPAHGALLVDESGTIRCAQESNSADDPAAFAILRQDGMVTTGPDLPARSTAHPAMDVSGSAVLLSGGRLVSVSGDLASEDLWRGPADEFAADRVLLLDGGLVACALGEELLIFRTSLGPLSGGSWPCASGNLRGNPVSHLALWTWPPSPPSSGSASRWRPSRWPAGTPRLSS